MRPSWALPSAGPLEFICQWPVFGIGETRVGIDAQLILDASREMCRYRPRARTDAAGSPLGQTRIRPERRVAH
jgi:hypothetical protein